ncbi:MAG: collagen-like protein [Chloroflexi bacterium]|nr:collagen-like protein [Chloroflexota bacterium]
MAAAIVVLGIAFAACTGSTGVDGPIGEQGASGPAGVDGKRGEPGLAGPAGDSGEPGHAAAQGEPGPQGSSGLRGVPGPQGSIGADGAQGPAGEQGPEGATGLTGPRGPAGPAGAAGEAGEVGSASELTGRALAPSTHTIEVVDTANAVGFDTSITIGTDGFPIISYRDGTNGDLKFVRCGNATCSADNTVVILDSEGVVGFDTSIAVGTDGFPIISYRDITNGNLKVAHCGTSDCTSGNTILTVDDLGRTGEGTSIAIGSDGLPIISFRDDFTEQLRVVHCGDLTCSENNLTQKLDNDDFGGFQSSIAIGVDGFPIIVYRIGITDDLRIIHCGNVRCSKDNVGRTLDSVGNVGFNPSIAIGSDGLPVIAYKNDSTSDLKFIRCEDITCLTKGDAETLDNGPLTGFDPSITIAADGLPIISYQDASKEDLVLIHCGDVGCTSGVVRNVVIGIGNAGAESSITIGVDGLPIIAYFAANDADLAVVHLANSYGVPYFRPR